jgi:hypothetical protein
MSSTFDQRDTRFYGPVQMGDGGIQMNNIRTGAAPEGLEPTVAALLQRLHEEVVASQAMDSPRRERFEADLQSVTDELAKPPRDRDQRRLRHCWDAVVAGAKDVGTVMGVVAMLSQATGLHLSVGH